MRVSYFLQNSNFSVDTVNITLILDFIFFKNFDCNFITCNDMCSLFYFTKCSFSFCLSDDKSTNLFSFRVLFFLNFFLTFLIIVLLFNFCPLFIFIVCCFSSLHPFFIIILLCLLLISHLYERIYSQSV